MAFSPDGRSVAFGGDDTKVSVWQIEPLRLMRTLVHGSYGFPIRLQYSPDGQLLAGAYSDGLARVWRDGQATELRGHKDVVSDIAFSPNGQILATRGNDDTVRLWRADNGEAIGVAQGARELEPRVWFSPDGRYVAATSRAGVAYLWDVEKIAEPPFVLAGHTGPVTALAFSPDGRTVATTSFDKTARLWDVETKTSRAVLAGHTDLLWWPAFSPDGRLLATTSSDQTARLWNPQLDEGGELAVRRYDSPVRLAGLDRRRQARRDCSGWHGARVEPGDAARANVRHGRLRRSSRRFRPQSLNPCDRRRSRRDILVGRRTRRADRSDCA